MHAKRTFECLDLYLFVSNVVVFLFLNLPASLLDVCVKKRELNNRLNISRGAVNSLGKLEVAISNEVTFFPSDSNDVY